MPESETEVVLQQNDAGRGIYSEFAAEAAQCSRCMGFSSRRSRWRLSVMRRDRDWGGASAASGMPSFGRRPAMTRILSGFRRQRPSGSRRIRRRSARGPEGQPEAPGVGSRRPRWSGPDPMVVWNGSRPSRAAGAAPITASQTRKIPRL